MLSDREGLTRVHINQTSIASKLLTDFNQRDCVKIGEEKWKTESSYQRSLISILMRRQKKSLIVQECPSM